MTLSRWVFTVSGVYGLVVLTPMLFLEAHFARDTGLPVNHPVYSYGFIGVALAWQFGFLVIGTDPVRYRVMMLPAIVERLSFLAAGLALFAQDRVPTSVLGFAVLDGLWGVLLMVAWTRTRGKAPWSSVKAPCLGCGFIVYMCNLSSGIDHSIH